MEKFDIYNDISNRTNGDIYIGVVGPVRTGKSTFIRKFMENFVIPNISNKLQKQIAIDDLPQSADGNTVMTTQPKFVPSNAVKVSFKNKTSANVRLVDCVGFVVDGAAGITDGDKQRLVKTPWDNKEIPFDKAAEIGTEKVINDYSTVGVLVTTDGSITDIKRESYVKAEEKTVQELKNSGKPFIIVLNCKNPNDENSLKLSNELQEKYDVSVVCENLLDVSEKEIGDIIEKLLLEFPMNSISVNMPNWLRVLPKDNQIIDKIINKIKESTFNIKKMKDFDKLNCVFDDDQELEEIKLKEIKLGKGDSEFQITPKDGYYFKVLSNECGEEINNDYELMNFIKQFSESKRKYSKIKDALSEAEENGYGVVVPTMEDMCLEEPTLIKQGGKYGVKLKAVAPSLHIVKVDVSAEVSPMVGNESQGVDLVNFVKEKYEKDPNGIWDTNMFGKPLNHLIGDDLENKINNMPNEARIKMRKTITKIVNENKGGVICILL